MQEDLIVQRVVQIRQSQRCVGGRKLLLMMNDFLEQHNIQIGRDSLFEILRDNALLVRRRKRKAPRTTWSNHWFRRHPYRVKDFIATAPGQLWVSDVTYIRLKEHFAYLSLITDAYSHKIVGFCLSRDLGTAGCVNALKMALHFNLRQKNLIHHSDRGVQYCCNEYVGILERENILISMTPDSDPRKNAIAERINGILKSELLQLVYNSFEEASEGIDKAVTIYNSQRLHSSIDMLTPQQAHHLRGEIKKRWKTYYKKRKEAPLPMI